MKRILISLIAIGAAYQVHAESPKWLRNTAINPDGTTIAFTYKGDIFTVPTAGGKAVQLTSNSAYDTAPVWSPDGKIIAFASNREGSMDIYTVAADGGTPTRITTNSGNETPLAFLDGHRLLYFSSVMPSAKTSRAFFAQTYVVDVTKPAARPELFVSLPMKQASAVNGAVLYADQKSVENVWRKHERSSGTSDIWVYDKKGFNKLTDFNGHDLNPVWKADGKGYYYISEEDGTLNVYENSINGTAKKQLTKFKEHPVRSLSASDNGVLAFSWDGEIYTLQPGKQPQKLAVSIVADEYNSDKVKSVVNSGVSNAAVSPAGDEIAFVLRGDIYVTDAKYQTTRRITNTPAQERNLEFSPDGKSIVYDSDRNGYWQLFLAKVKDPEEKRFTYATEIIEEPLYKCVTSAQQPSFSPDGKKVAFLEGRDAIRVVDVKSKKAVTALDGKYNYSYSDGDISFSWSPDSKWLVATFFENGGWNNSDIALVKADGSEVINLTESGFITGNPKWVLGGKGITFQTSKYGMKNTGSWGNQTDIILMMLDQEAWDVFNMNEEELALKEKADKAKKEKEDKEKKEKEDKEKKSKKDDKKSDKKDENKTDKKDEKSKDLEFDIENRNYRTARLTRSGNLGDYYLNPKGTKLFFMSPQTEGGSNLYVTDLKKGETKVLSRGLSGGMVADSKGENLYVLSGRGMQKVNLTSGQTEPISFSADYDRKPSLEREYIFDHMARQVNDKFYDENLHGVNWDKYTKHYREFLPYIDNNQDFSIMLSEILGELNASHTGSGYRAPGAQLPTASLGAFYDENYKGDGLKIEELLPRSPLASKKIALQPGDLILSIDGKKIEAGKDYFPLLEGKSGRTTRLEVKRAGGKVENIVVKPLAQTQISDMIYQRWVKNNEKFVDSISGGKIGYVHIEGMNTSSYQTAYDRILGKYRNCDAIVVDTRHNGGGWLHNDLAVLLNGKEYVQFRPRGKYIGSEPFSQWHKPSVMLIDESNYSDAHGSPYTYKTLGIGDLVGAPIPGTMTAVWWETQIDPTLYFGIPQVTNCDMNGKPLENRQLNPDVLIYNRPEEELRGYDAQLAGAVNHLLKKTRK